MLFVGMFDASVQKVLRQFVARGSPHPISTPVSITHEYAICVLMDDLTRENCRR